MASCKEKSLPAESCCISQRFTGDNKPVQAEKIQEQSSTEKTKINRLKRAKRTRKPDVTLSEGQVIRPDVTEHHHDEKSYYTSSTESTRPPDTQGAQCSPPKQGPVPHMQMQNKLEVKSESTASPHLQPSVLAEEAGSLRRRRSRAERWDLRQHEKSERENETVCNPYPNWIPEAPRHRARFQSSAAFFKDAHVREDCLQQVHARKARFPVRRLIQTLLKRHESQFSSGESKSTPVVPEDGKRKQEVESVGNGRHHKRQRSRQDDTETANTSDGHVNSRHGAMSRSRKRRKVSQDEGHAGQDDDTGHDEDVPWTEKYRPRRCDEVVGNSAAVRRLYSWLKEWKIRADVEERRKRREERRIKVESEGSWDRGDFKGDPLTEECEGELCNTLLIYGPTGVGKSAAVFACAEQLSFKVLEVNSSSLRTGRLVLSQLRESTQSHQVGALQRPVSLAHTPAAASREEAPQESVSSGRKPIPRTASRKKSAAPQNSVTLTRYFRKTGKLVSKHSELPRDTEAAEDVTRVESDFKKDGVLDEKDKTVPMSLILFEEVDIIFEEDVGFLAAVRSLMRTTKRPIILTTNDPFFGESFDGHFEAIRFKTPAVESVLSYLQRVCVVQSVKLDLEHIRFMLQENNGDVRRSVLELELWVRSGAGNTHHHLHNRALTCRSYAVLESSRCVEVMVESWRKGRSLIYSNLDLLLAPPTVEKADQGTFDCMFRNKAKQASSPPTSRKQSRLKMKKDVLKTKHLKLALPLDRFKQTNQSAAEAPGCSKVDSLARFFDTMSFIDSYLSRWPCCKSGPLGAKTADGLLDEPRDEEGSEMSTHSLERCYEILAVVEGLGFHGCRVEVCPVRGGAWNLMGGDGNKTWKLSEQECGEVVHKVLRSKAFRYHGNQTAIVTDYVPCLRLICREQRAAQQPELRVSHYLRDIGLHLPKSLLNLLASQPH